MSLYRAGFTSCPPSNSAHSQQTFIAEEASAEKNLPTPSDVEPHRFRTAGAQLCLLVSRAHVCNTHGSQGPGVWISSILCCHWGSECPPSLRSHKRPFLCSADQWQEEGSCHWQAPTEQGANAFFDAFSFLLTKYLEFRQVRFWKRFP